jgi:hypothetical protein
MTVVATIKCVSPLRSRPSYKSCTGCTPHDSPPLPIVAHQFPSLPYLPYLNLWPNRFGESLSDDGLHVAMLLLTADLS